jgi:hypothetical protein
MIVLRDKEILIMTPPHTASRNLHYSCCEQLRAVWFAGPNPDGLIDHHTNCYIQEFDAWKKFIVVRNPFYRIVGLWHHLVDWCSYNGNGCCDFSKFVGMVHKDDKEQLSWMYRYTISRWLTQRIDGVIRYENLELDLENIGIKIELNQSKPIYRKEIEEYYDGETRILVEDWAKEDFEKFQYKWPEKSVLYSVGIS